MAGGSDSGSNFRYSYYDKAGIRCNLNETKALDAVLSRDPVDITKLCSLLQRISVPPTHRARLWKFILGVTPADRSIAAGIEEDRRGQFEELRSTLQVMRLIDQNSSNADIVTLMILLERGELQLDPAAQMTTPAVRDLHVMFSVMCRVAPKLQDAYWLARNFYNHLLALRIDTKELINQTRILLEKDDPALLERILSSTALNRSAGVACGSKANQGSTGSASLIPIERWFNFLFASVLPDAALLKVWDKFLGGVGNKHLAMTAKLIIVALRPLLMPSTVTQKLRLHHHLHHYSLSPGQGQNYASNPSTATTPSGPNQPSYPQQNPPHQQLQEQQQPLQCHGQSPPGQQGHPAPQRQPLQTSNSQNQSPNTGSSPTQQQVANQGSSPPSKVLGEVSQMMSQPQPEQAASQQLNYPACCAGVEENLTQEGENLNGHGGDPLQQSQLATILNQPLSDDMAGPLIAIL